MIGIDTNLLVRLAANDHNKQSLIFREAMAGMRAQNQQCFINSIVLCETVWVLKSRYGMDKNAIIKVLELFLVTHDFVFEDNEILDETLEIFKRSNVGLADILIALRNKKSGCKHTLTFDTQAAKVKGFKKLG